MKLNEVKQVKKISKEFTEAIKFFTKKEYEKARDLFNNIVEQHKDSEYYSILDVQTRSKVYKNICDAQINPVKIELKSNEDYLYEGIFCLNSGDLDRALELFNYIKNNKYNDPYLDYLTSIAYLKKDDIESSLKHLKMCVQKDEIYKVIAHNESDFDPLFEDEDFLLIIEC